MNALLSFHPDLVLAMSAPPGQGTSPLVQFIPFVLVLGIFYFVILLPMKRRQKKVDEFLGGLKVGDKVVTTGGLYGTVAAPRRAVGAPAGGAQRAPGSGPQRGGRLPGAAARRRRRHQLVRARFRPRRRCGGSRYQLRWRGWPPYIWTGRFGPARAGCFQKQLRSAPVATRLIARRGA